MAEFLQGEIELAASPKLIFGPGTVAARLRAEIESLGLRQAMIVTGKTLATKTDLVTGLRAILGDRCAGVFDATRQHVPRETVLAGAALAGELGADALVAFGGSTPADTAKGIALVLAEGPNFDAHKGHFDSTGRHAAPPLPRPKLPIVAIPTTLSGGEFSHAAGITDMGRHVKELYFDPKLIARAAILDPEMTIATGKELWAGTGIKILCDCVEVACSPRHQPYSDAMAAAAAATLFRDLPSSVGEPLDLPARGRLQYASWMATNGGRAVGTGLAAALRHQLGPMWNVPHGTVSSIVIPHVMEFNLPVVADRLASLARATGIDDGRRADDAARALIAAMRDLAVQLGLPSRLRDVGGRREDFEAVAAHVFGEQVATQNPRPITNKEQLLALLERAY